MSNLLVYVLVSGSTSRVFARAEYMMASYHNEFEVEEYEAECWCNRNGNNFDPDCEVCGGTGKRMTTFNPMGKHDGYFEIDYDDVFQDVPKRPAGMENEDLLALLPDWDIDELRTPDAIVTPDGNWHETDWSPLITAALMGEGEYSDYRNSACWQPWRNTVKEISTKYPNAYLVALHCRR